MKKLIVTTTFLIMSTATGSFAKTSAPAPKPFEFSKSILTPFYQSDEFLIRLGFRNFSDEAQETLDTAEKIHEVAELTLKNNVTFHGAMKSAKYLGDLTYAFLKLNENLSPQKKLRNIQLMVNITSQQMMPFPLIGLEPITDPAYLHARGEKAFDLRIDYLGQRVIERQRTEKANLLKSYSYLYDQLENEKFKTIEGFQTWMDRRIGEAIRDAYVMSNAQQNRHLGRALLAVMIKYARETKNANIENQLRTQLASVGVKMDEVLSAKFSAPTADKNRGAYQLKNGDIALEFSNGREAYFTSMGAEPSTPENLVLAKKLDLISSYSNLPLFAQQKYYDDALDKTRSNLFLNPTESKVLVDYWDPEISKGYSHVGMVEVRADAASRISYAWVWDSYPNLGVGGIRLMNPEGFAYPERFVRIGFARYSAKKVLASFKKQIRTRGYLQTVLESTDSVTLINPQTKRVEPYQAADTTYQWPTNISKEEVLKLTQSDDAQAEAWYQNTILPKVFEQYEKYVVSEEALAFAANMVNTRGMAYCSQVVRLAFLQSVNFDPAPTPDQYRKLPAFLLKHFPKAVGFEVGAGFVSPSGLVWQTDILESYSKFNFTHERGEEQRQSRSRVDHYNSYLGTDGDVNAMPILIKPTEIKIGEAYVGDDLNQ